MKRISTPSAVGNIETRGCIGVLRETQVEWRRKLERCRRMFFKHSIKKKNPNTTLLPKETKK